MPEADQPVGSAEWSRCRRREKALRAIAAAAQAKATKSATRARRRSLDRRPCDTSWRRAFAAKPNPGDARGKASHVPERGEHARVEVIEQVAVERP